MLSRLLTVREQVVLVGLAASIILGSATMFYYHRAETAPGVTPIPPPPVPIAHTEEPATQKPAAAPPAPNPAMPEPAQALAAIDPPEEKAEERVGAGIIGAVNKPGLYYFEPGARVTHLIRAAGGAAPGADLSDINQAARLIDGTTLAIPKAREVRRAGESILRSGIDPAAYNPAPYTLSRAHAPVSANQAGLSDAPAYDGGSAAANARGLLDLNTADQDALETLPGIGEVLAARIIAFREYSPFTSVDDLRQVEGIGEKKLEAVRPFVTVGAAPGSP